MWEWFWVLLTLAASGHFVGFYEVLCFGCGDFLGFCCRTSFIAIVFSGLLWHCFHGTFFGFLVCFVFAFDIGYSFLLLYGLWEKSYGFSVVLYFTAEYGSE